MPWPAGYRASAQAYELVGVEIVDASKDYTIPIRRQDFAINTGSQFPKHRRPDCQRRRQGGRLGAAARPGRKGDGVTGGSSSRSTAQCAEDVLDYMRPAVQVSGSRTSFPAKTFSVGLVG